MNTITSLSLSDESPVPAVPAFNEEHSLAIRIWHWTFFLLITASLVTVLFASTLFKTSNTVALVQDQLQEKGATVSKDQARAVSHEFSDKLWNLHTYIGYFLCGLLLIRVIIEIAQPRDEKLSTKLKSAAGFSPATPSEKRRQQHYMRVKTGYIVFYMLILTMALTGLGLAFEDVPLFKAWHGAITQIHAFVQYLIYGFIVLHLVGVIKADLSAHKGLVSGMIHGKKRK